MKIKFKLLIAFLFISLVPFFAISIVSLYSSQSALVQSIGTKNLSLVREKARSVQWLIRERILETEHLASMKEIKDAIDASNALYENRPQGAIRSSTAKRDKAWIRSKGATRLAEGILASSLSSFLRKYVQKRPNEYGEIFVTDVRGAVVAMTGVLSDYSQSDEGWWVKSYNKGKGAKFIDYRGIDASVNATVLGIVVPIRERDEVIGLLKVNYRIKEIFDIVSSSGLARSGEIFILSSHGDIVAYSGKYPAKGVDAQGVARLSETKDGWHEAVSRGVKTIEAYARISSDIYKRVLAPGAIKGVSGEKWESSTWYIFDEVNQTEAFAPIRRIRNIVISSALICLILVVLLALYIAKNISRPIKILREGAGVIGSGNLEHRIDISTNDEIGELSRAFNAMAGDLKSITASREELAAEVMERENAQAALIDNQERYKEAQRITNLGHWDLDIVNNELYWSDEIYRILEIDPHESGASHEAFLSVVHPDDRDMLGTTYKESLVHKTGYSVVYRLLLKGSVKYVNERCETIYDRRGLPLRSIGTVQDITERVLERKKLEQSNALLDAIGGAQSHFIQAAEQGKTTFAIVLEYLLKLTESKGGFIAETLYKENGSPYLKPLAGRDVVTSEAGQETSEAASSVGLEQVETDNLLSRVIETGKPVIINDTKSDTHFAAAAQGGRDISALLCLPLYKGERQLGILCVTNRPGGYDSAIIEYLTPFLDTCASLIAAYINSRERKDSDEALSALYESSTTSIGLEFFNEISKSLVKLFCADCVIVGEIIDGGRVKALSMLLDGNFIKNFTYELKGTPCCEAREKGFTYYSSGVGDIFSVHMDSIGLRAEGYAGMPVKDDNGHVIGIICVISRAKLHTVQRAEEILSTLASRVSVEIERKRASNALKIVMLEYGRLIENVPDAIYSCLPEPERPMTFVSKRWWLWTGYESEDCYDDGCDIWNKAIHPDDRAKAVRIYSDACSNKTEFIVEYRVVHKDTGFVRHLMDHGVPVNDSNGNLEKFDGVITDISARKEAQERLKRAARQRDIINELLSIPIEDISLSEILERSAGIIFTLSWLCKPERGCIFLIDNDRRALELKAHRGIEGNCEVRDRVLPLEQSVCALAVSSGEVRFVEGKDDQFEFGDSNATPYHHYCIPMKRVRKVIGVVNFYVDISHKRDVNDEESLKVIVSTLAMLIERKCSETAIRESNREMMSLIKKIKLSKEQWERTVDCLDDNFVILADIKGSILRCSRAFKEFTGLSYNELNGKATMELIAERDIEIREVSKGCSELYHRGSGRWFNLSTYPYKASGEEGQDPKSEGSVIIIHDITTIKKVSAEIESKNAELEKAYSELKNTQSHIIQQEKLASIGQIAAGVAHEINNPMSFISSNIDTLDKYASRLVEFTELQAQAIEKLTNRVECEEVKARRRELNIDYIMSDIFDMIAESRDGADRVKKIVQDLKLFSRAERNKEPVSIDLHKCIDSTINIVWNEIKYKASLDKEYGDIPFALGYPQQISQVFLNLLVNAAQSIEKEGTITIRSWHKGASIYISITDTGAGIAPENLPKLFEPFFTTKVMGEGTGLGLSISYDIIKRHNGELSVESELGKGTTFTVSLPAEGESEKS